MKKTSMLLAIVVLAGCATEEQFRKNMDSFMYASESQLVSRMGPPQNSYQTSDGARILQYSSSRTVVLPGVTTMQPVTANTTGYFGATPYSQRTTTYVPQQGPSTSFNTSCVINFTISASGIVTAWNARGNDCKATPPR